MKDMNKFRDTPQPAVSERWVQDFTAKCIHAVSPADVHVEPNVTETFQRPSFTALHFRDEVTHHGPHVP